MGRLGLGLLMLGLWLAAGAGEARAAELIMFDDPGCVWCRKWLAEVGPGYPKTPEGRRAPLRRIQIGDQARAGVTLKTPVTGTPTFVLADESREVGRITGYPGADYFYPLLDELLAKLSNSPAPKSSLRDVGGFAK